MTRPINFLSKILCLLLFAVHINTYAQQTKYYVSFAQYCAGKCVVLNQYAYTNELGTKYQINQIQYFISDIELHVNGKWIGNPELVSGNPRLFENNCCYIDCENESPLLQFNTKKHKATIDSIRFVFGISREKNISYSLTYPELARMYWPEVLGGGYHYMKTNIKFIDSQDSVSLFNCHLGRGVENDTFIDNDFKITLPCHISPKDKLHHLVIIMNVDKWFSEPNKIDFNLYTKGIMGKQDIMSQISENGKNVFELRINN